MLGPSTDDRLGTILEQGVEKVREEDECGSKVEADLQLLIFPEDD